ncbi:MAG TPA: alpha-glucosidase [Bacillota bacterium]|jgi:glycosidase|nr:alpha-glucosidase [Bacillota bacterium]HPT68203.1 alpha-glucosidase [Bacillota bacterium]
MTDWYKDAIVYQIYTRSFFDANGDGIGDFAGVMAKLDYLKDLGVDVLWLSPFCLSANDDNGYDISDYYRVMPEYGTMAELAVLIAESHCRGMKIMMDLVMNHTSDEHPWFLAAKSGKAHPMRDYYIWAPKKGGQAPNNWESFFEGSAWTEDEATGECFLHLFSKRQPDLNWSNPKVRRELHRIATWWVERGIDAFRLDAIHLIGKPAGLPDAPEPTVNWPFHNFCNTPETHEYLQEFNQEVFGKYSVMTVGETGGTTPESARLYVETDRKELDMIFHFGHVHETGRPKDAGFFRKYYQEWYEALSPKGWDAVFFSNHDLPRHVSHLGDDKSFRAESAKLFATMLLTLWGTPYIYQGEEIGMTNVRFSSLDDYRDLAGKKIYRAALAKGYDSKQAWEEFCRLSRDNARTPMQWTAGKNAGFTQGTPWIGVNPNHVTINVEEQAKDPDSVFNYYKKLIALRKTYSALARGSFRLYGEEHPQIFAYIREDEHDAFLVLLNISGQPGVMQTGEAGRWSFLLGNYVAPAHDLPAALQLNPWEARIYRRKK